MEIISPQSFGFPPTRYADEEGLLCMGGNLHPARLIAAYAQGIFPWFEEGADPILWWTPSPRFVLLPCQLRVSKSMQQVLRRQTFSITTNQAFPQVMRACGRQPRRGQDGTWIGPSMVEAYTQLHRLGIAHSVEAWQGGELVGGLYGLRLGNIFFGESMFAQVANASKAAFITYVRQLQAEGVALIDCQTHTPHLESLGATMMDRAAFEQHLHTHIDPLWLRQQLQQAIEIEW